MKRSGSDYWKLYHDDFFDDELVLPLSAAEVGIYLWLLGLQAKHGSLPGSDAALAAMGRRWGRDWGKAWPKLAKFFPTNDSGNRENPRQAFELSEVDASRSKQTSRKARWRDQKRALSTGTSAGQGRGQDWDGDALSRTRGEERREEERREEETRQDMPPAEASANKSRAPKRQKPKTERAPATGPEAEIIQAFEAAFLAKRKATYAFEGGKDGSAVKRLLAFAGGDPRAVIDRIPLLFADEWYGPKATLSMFVMAWNKLPVHKLKAVTTPTFDEFEYTRKRLAQEEERRRLASGGGA